MGRSHISTEAGHLEGITLHAERGTNARLLGGLVAGGPILVVGASTQIVESPAIRLNEVRFVIKGDVVSGTRVSLSHTLVLGNIIAPEVELRYSIVIGTVIAAREPGFIRVVCSTLGLYRAASIVIEGPTTFTTPGGSSGTAPVLEPHVLPATSPGNAPAVLSPRMRLLGLCRLAGTGCADWNSVPPNTGVSEAPALPIRIDELRPGICCPHWTLGSCAFRPAVELYLSDFIPVKVQLDTTETPAHSGKPVKMVTAREGKPEDANTRWVLQTQARAMDLVALRRAEGQYERVLRLMLAWDSLPASDRRLAMYDDWISLSDGEKNLLHLAVLDERGADQPAGA